MAVPSFPVTGNLKDILGSVVSGALSEQALSGARIEFQSNVPEDHFVTWANTLYRVPTVYGRVDSAGNVTNMDGDQLRLLANDDGLNIRGLQWRIHITVPASTIPPTAKGSMAPWRINAPGANVSIDLRTSVPVPGMPVTGAPSTGGGDGGPITADEITDSTVVGRLLIRAAGATSARQAIDAPSTGEVTTAVAGVATQVSTVDAAIRSDMTTALNAREVTSAKGQANGYAPLGADVKIPAQYMPDVAIVDFLGVKDSQAEMLALTGQKGDWVTRSDTGSDYQIIGNDPTQIASWRQMTYPASPVSTVAGLTGAITAPNLRSALSLDQVNNTPDTNKPVSTAQQTALNAKVDKTSTANRVYLTDNAGNQAVAPYDDQAGTPTSVVLRTPTGTVRAAAPTNGLDVGNKTYIDTADGLKVDKSAVGNIIYGTDNAGLQSIRGVDTGASAFSVAQRDAAGALTVSVPTAAGHAGTKAYIDAADAQKVSVVTYSGNLSAPRPVADAVYWVDFPSTPVNAQAQDILEGLVDPDITALGNLGDGYPRRASGTWQARTAGQFKRDLGVWDAWDNSPWSSGHAEPFPRQGLTANPFGSQTAEFAYFTAPVANTITKLGFCVVAGGASAGLTVSRAALYTVDGSGNLTMVARTANDLALGSTGDALTQSALATAGGFPASYTFIPGQRYALGVLQVGTTPSSVVVNFLNTGPAALTPQISGRVFGQSDLAASYTAANVGPWYKAPYLLGIA